MQGRTYSMPMRPERGRIVAGVCLAVGERTSIDVTLVRLAFLVLGLAWGIGVIIYAALWLLMPDASRPEVTGSVRDTVRSNARRMGPELRSSLDRASLRGRHEGARRDPDRLLVGAALVAGGGILFLAAIGALDWVTPLRALGLVAIAAGTYAVMAERGK